LKFHRDNSIQEIIVISSQIDYLRVMLPVEQQFDELGMPLLPFDLFASNQTPSVNNISAQDERVASIFLEKFRHLLCLRPF
jgi:hypothetical protein